MGPYGLQPHVSLRERWPLLRLQLTAGDRDLDELLRTIGLAVLLPEQLHIEAEVTRPRQVVRIGLHAANDLAANDAEREDVDALVVDLVLEHLGRHREGVADDGVAGLARLWGLALEFALGRDYEGVGGR